MTDRMTGGDLAYELQNGTLETRAAAGTLPKLDDYLVAYSCSRCGRGYREHSHSLEKAHAFTRIYGAALVPNETQPRLHAFRTQPEVGRLVEPNGDGLVFPDGEWDA